MRTFNVYKHPTKGFETVKVGFSWTALFFGVFWMLVNELWSFAALWVAIIIIAKVVEALTDHMQASMLQVLIYLALAACYFALGLVPAFKGNRWRDRNLIKDGYECVGTVQAKNPVVATAQFVGQA